jgi:hypothetical protein
MTITVYLVNDDSEKRDLEVSSRDASVTESEYEGPYPLKYGDRKERTLVADASDLGAVDWITEGANHVTDNGTGRRLANNAEVKVRLPSSTVDKKRQA